MFAITDKSGIKSILFDNIQNLLDEYTNFLLAYKINISYDIITKEINEKGFFKFDINDHTYYIIKTILY